MTWRMRIFVALILLLLPACASKVDDPKKFDTEIFENDRYSVALGFDLRNDDNPMAGLIINAQNVTQTEYHTIALPFASAAEANETLFSTSGSFHEAMLVNYYLMPTTNKSFSIGMIPIFQPGPETYYNSDDIQSSVTLVRMGLERVFVYRYPEQDVRRTKWLQKEGALANTKIEAIGIAWPQGAVGQEIRDTGLTAVPTSIYIKTGAARFYPASSPASGEKALEVRYKLPPTQAQKLVLEYGVKFILTLIAPITQLIVKNPKGQKGKKYRIFTYVLIGIQIIILTSLIIFAFLSWGESSVNAILDLAIAIIGGFLAGYVLWQENKFKPKSD